MIVGRSMASSAFSPSSLSPDFWFDVSDLSTMFVERTGASATTAASVGGPVGSFKNKGAADGWATGFNDGARPILRQSGALYYLEFVAATSQYLNLGVGVSCTGTTKLTSVYGISRNSTGVYTAAVANGSGQPLVPYWWSDNKIYYDSGSTSASTSTGAFVISNYDHQGGSGDSYLRRNKTSLATYSGAATNATLTAIGFPNPFCTQYLYNILIWYKELNATDLGNAETWVGAKSGLSI